MAEGQAFQCCEGVAEVRVHPALGPERVTDLLFGETFLGHADGELVVGRTAADGVEGIVRASALRPRSYEPTHRVCRPFIRVFREAHLAAATEMVLPMNALVQLTGRTAKINYPSGGLGSMVAEIATGEWVTCQGVRPVDEHDEDIETTARSFLGTAYLHGGRTALGCDASGLVQSVMAAHGVHLPRTLDAQVRALAGHEIETTGGNLRASACCLIAGGDDCGLVFQDRVVAASTATMLVTEGSLKDFLASPRQSPARLFDLSATLRTQSTSLRS